MENRLERKELRRTSSIMAWAVLAYYGIMNAAVLLVDVPLIVYRMMKALISGDILDPLEANDMVMEIVMGNGWGYLLAVAVGGLILWLWKGNAFCFREMWRRERRMDAGSFFSLLAVFVSGQMVVQIVSPLIEWVLNLFGFSAMAALETATMEVDTLSMFLYVALIGPVAEEVLFRGLVLRSLQPYGKRLAIVASAVMFGVFHGNVIQIPYAFAVGLVLGYAAAEFSILWAIVLHLFNNFVLSFVMSKVTAPLPEEVAGGIFLLIIAAFTVAAVCVLIVRRREVAAYFRENRVAEKRFGAFFSSVGVIVLLAVMLLFAVFTITKL